MFERVVRWGWGFGGVVCWRGEGERMRLRKFGVFI